MMQHSLRLQGQTYARVEKERADQYAQPVLRLWEIVFDEGESRSARDKSQ